MWGKATDASVDSDEQIIDADFAAKAMEDFFGSGPNIRVQHQAQRDPAGVGVSYERDGDAHWLKAKVIEPVAKSLVLGGALRAYSVGIALADDHPRRSRPGRPDHRRAVRRGVAGGPPANKNCGIALVKTANDEWVGKVFGSDDVLAKAMSAAPAVSDVTLTFPSDVQMSFSPLDMAKIVARKNGSLTNFITKQVETGVLSVDEGREKLGLKPWDLPETSTLEKAEALIEDREYDETFIGKGKLSTDARNALPDSAFVFPAKRKYPIHDKNHARNALSRVAANGTPEEQAKVRAAVARRAPGHREEVRGQGGGEGGCDCGERGDAGHDEADGEEGKGCVHGLRRHAEQGSRLLLRMRAEDGQRDARRQEPRLHVPAVR